MIAPTPEKLEQMYLEHDAFIERAIEWDRNELQMIRDWESKKQELDHKFADQRQQLTQTQSFDPSKPKQDLVKQLDQEESALAEGNQLTGAAREAQE